MQKYSDTFLWHGVVF